MRNLSLNIMLVMIILIGLAATCFGANTPPPSGPSSIWFSGYKWKVKHSDDLISPGPYFLNSTRNLWVDRANRLHIKIIKYNGRWYCSEVACENSFGFGKYIFYLASPVGKLNKNAVLGLFTWSDSHIYNYRENDIEFSRWGRSNGANAQYVIQPWSKSGNMHRFKFNQESCYSTHCFTWQKKSIVFQSFTGQTVSALNIKHLVQQWDCHSKDIPLPGDEKVHINLFLTGNKPPSDGKEVEVIIKKFQFIP
jgi:hypothetical protein